MEPVTIGPIPNEIILPKLAPRIIDKYSNCCNAFCPNPNKGICPRIKKAINIIRVHLSFSLKGSLF